jgi:hypothetical protein
LSLTEKSTSNDHDMEKMWHHLNEYVGHQLGLDKDKGHTLILVCVCMYVCMYVNWMLRNDCLSWY